jgi:arylsulfatase A-like enzyme
MSKPPLHISRRDFLRLAGLVPPALLALTGSQLDDTQHRAQAAPGGKMNVLIVVFDALTARNMSLFGYPRQTTPVIERLAERAYVFHRHYAGGNFTSPGTASLLTGVYPWTHRGFNYGGEMVPAFNDRNVFAQFASEYRTFAFTHNKFVNILLHQMKDHIRTWLQPSDLALASFDTLNAVFSEDFFASSEADGLVFWREEGPSSSFILSKLLDKRRTRQSETIKKQRRGQHPLGLPSSPAKTQFFTLQQAINQTSSLAASGNDPFMGYVHYLPPHAPYVPNKGFYQLFNDDNHLFEPKPASIFAPGERQEKFFQTNRRNYDAFIAEVDAEFGRLYRRLKRAGALENTILVLTSDHGELFERGLMGHTTPALYDPVIHIPLVIWMPGSDQRHDIHTPTSAVDVLPTLLSLNGLPVPEWVEGGLLPEITGRPAQPDRSLFALEAKENPKYDLLKKFSLAMIQGDYKLVSYNGYQKKYEPFELYNLVQDPEELTNLYGTTGDLENQLRRQMLDTLQQRDVPAGV